MLCLTCNRVRPATSPLDYTAARARLITRHGLCICGDSVLAVPVIPVVPAERSAEQAPARQC